MIFVITQLKRINTAAYEGHFQINKTNSGYTDFNKVTEYWLHI
jgi:hypothetical protein